MNLFGLSDDPRRRIIRIPLAGPVQQEVEALFQQQEGEFRAKAKREVLFNGIYKPEDDECLTIDNFDDIDGLANAIIDSSAVTVFAPTAGDLPGIKAIFAGRVDANGDAVVLLQAFEKRRILSTGGMLTMFLERDIYKKFDTAGITLDRKLTAILHARKLSFFSFFFARRIFDLSGHYIEATDQDIADFAALPMVQVNDQAKFMDNMDNWVRRKIALIKQSGVLDEISINEIKRVAAEFAIDLGTETHNGTEAIVMPDDKLKLKQILKFLDEDYYRSSLRALLHETNSKIRI